MINITEAIHIASQGKNKYRAFEKLEEVLVLAGQAEQTVKERTREKERLDSEIADLKSKKDGLEKLIPGFERAVEKASNDFGEKTTVMQKELDDAGQLAKKNHDDLLSNFNQLASKAKEEFNIRIKKLEEEEKDVQGRVNGLKKSLAGLLDQAKKVEL